LFVVCGLVHFDLFGARMVASKATKATQSIIQLPRSVGRELGGDSPVEQVNTRTRVVKDQQALNVEQAPQSSRSTPLFPSMPADIIRRDTPPTLYTSPNSSISVFTPHHHDVPYKGTAYHLSSAIHPYKDVLDHNHYILSSAWFFEQDDNLDWTKVGVQGLLPYSMAHLSFTCEYAPTAKAAPEEWEQVQARTVLQGRKEYVHVECPLPSWATLDKEMKADDLLAGLHKFGQGHTKIKAWLEWGGPDVQEKDPWQKWRTSPLSDQARAASRVDSEGKTQVLAATHLITSHDWTPSGQGNKLGVCLSPISLKSSVEERKTQLREFIEWRVWHGFGGVEVVHWAARDPAMSKWVDELNTVLGLHDTFIHAPPGSPSFITQRKPYGDQVTYLADCLMRHGVTDEYQAMIDLDEFMLPRDDPSPWGIVRRLEALPPLVGTFSIDHTYFGGGRSESAAKVDALPLFPRNARTMWDTLERVDGYRRQKSIYRTAATKAIWVHSHTELGRSFWREMDRPIMERTEDSKKPEADRISNLELLHDRNPAPPKLKIEQKIDENMTAKWQAEWAAMAQVLNGERMEGLFDLDVDLA